MFTNELRGQTQLPPNVLAEVSRLFWVWYDLNQDEVILRRRILFFSVSLKVGDLKSVFERIFGARVP